MSNRSGDDCSGSCMDVFDTAYLKKCWSGPYEKRYFFNHEKKQCELFYYGGCMSTSKNIFLSYDECEDLCETPSYELFSQFFLYLLSSEQKHSNL